MRSSNVDNLHGQGHRELQIDPSKATKNLGEAHRRHANVLCKDVAEMGGTRCRIVSLTDGHKADTHVLPRVGKIWREANGEIRGGRDDEVLKRNQPLAGGRVRDQVAHRGRNVIVGDDLPLLDTFVEHGTRRTLDRALPHRRLHHGLHARIEPNGNGVYAFRQLRRNRKVRLVDQLAREARETIQLSLLGASQQLTEFLFRLFEREEPLGVCRNGVRHPQSWVDDPEVQAAHLTFRRRQAHFILQGPGPVRQDLQEWIGKLRCCG